jgi:hypothetical protein
MNLRLKKPCQLAIKMSFNLDLEKAAPEYKNIYYV